MVLSPFLNADTPIERFGKSREDVRLLTYSKNEINHDVFRNLCSYFQVGDVLVLNNSRTIPAVINTVDGMEVRLSRQVTDHIWDALLPEGFSGELIFETGVSARVLGDGSEKPLKRLQFSSTNKSLLNNLYLQGDVVRYEHSADRWPLSDYQTVYASQPGSVEMPSAGRAFTWWLLTELKEAGVELVFITLHAGLSYYGRNRWPTPSLHPEPYVIDSKQAQVINHAKASGRQVIAVGTTVVRALESASDKGEVTACEDETNLFIKEARQLTVVDGMLTGFHEEEASHMHMLEAFIGKEAVHSIYKEAIDKGYLWHEFGDMNLIMKESLG
ncbi:S-adenosylmethionine:tRNA ribosyltransferase-isomerase [Bacillus sp. JCM 19041]|uniref:S-adenosylmethionine:tRNA ribosyltransferase-isomerase n=1 Tax=Bacillus sp. JCM 19041 TaxID=1460637 RepID=UPI0006D20139